MPLRLYLVVVSIFFVTFYWLLCSLPVVQRDGVSVTGRSVVRGCCVEFGVMHHAIVTRTCVSTMEVWRRAGYEARPGG